MRLFANQLSMHMYAGHNQLSNLDGITSVESLITDCISLTIDDMQEMIFKAFCMDGDLSYLGYNRSVARVNAEYFNVILESIVHSYDAVNITHNYTNPKQSAIHAAIDNYICKSSFECQQGPPYSADYFAFDSVHQEALAIVGLARELACELACEDKRVFCITSNQELKDAIILHAKYARLQCCEVGYKNVLHGSRYIATKAVLAIIKAITTWEASDIEVVSFLAGVDATSVIYSYRGRGFSLSVVDDIACALGVMPDTSPLLRYQDILARDNNRHYLAKAVLSTFMSLECDFDENDGVSENPTQPQIVLSNLTQVSGIEGQKVILAGFNGGLNASPAVLMGVHCEVAISQVAQDSQHPSYVSTAEILTDIASRNSVTVTRSLFDNNNVTCIISRHESIFDFTVHPSPAAIEYPRVPKRSNALLVERTITLPRFMSAYEFAVLHNDRLIYYLRFIKDIKPWQCVSQWRQDMSQYRQCMKESLIAHALGLEYDVQEGFSKFNNAFYSKMRAAHIESAKRELLAIIEKGKGVYQTCFIRVDSAMVYKAVVGVINDRDLYVLKSSYNIDQSVAHAIYTELAAGRAIYEISVDGPSITVTPVEIAYCHDESPEEVTVWHTNTKRHKSITAAFLPILRETKYHYEYEV